MIFGMDLLRKYKAHLDFHCGRVQFETGNGKIKYQGVRPNKGSLVVSAVQVERLLEKGFEAYLAAITTMEVGPDAEFGDIPILYDDVFKSLIGLLPDRSNARLL